MLVFILILYLIAILSIGFYASKFTKDREGFMLANRSLGSGVTALSLFFSGASGWVLVGYLGLSYKIGANSFWILIGFLVCYILAYVVFGARLRNYSQLLGALSYTDYFVLRFRDNTHLIRIIATISIIVFMTTYVSAQLLAVGKILIPLFGLSMGTAVILSGLFVVLYSILGGYLAVCWTDYFQGLIVIIGTLSVSIYLIITQGGISNLLSNVAQTNPFLVTGSLGAEGVGSVMWAGFGLFIIGIPMLGRPHDTIRFFSIKSSKKLRESLFILASAFLLLYWASFTMALSGKLMFPQLADPEMLFSVIIIEKLNPFFGGILLAAFVALMMSTTDSLLLVISTSLSQDIYLPYIDKKADDKRIVLVARICVFFAAVVATIYTLYSTKTVFYLAIFAAGGLSATFTSTLFLSLYWKRMTKWGAIAAMAVGFLTTIIWVNIPILKGFIHEVLPATILSLLAGYIVSLNTKPHNQKEIEEEFKKIVLETEQITM